MKSSYFSALFLFCISIFIGCARGPYTPKEQPMQKKELLTLPPDLLKSKNQPESESKKDETPFKENDQTSKTKQEERYLNPNVKSVLDNQKTNVPIELLRVQSPKEKLPKKILDADQLSIQISNKSNKKLLLAAFYYTKVRLNGYWRWVKSPVITLEHNETKTIPIQAFDDAEIKKDICGYIGVFNTQEEAEKATFESLNDDQKIDLDHLIELQETTIEITISSYGFKTNQIDYRLRTADDLKKTLQPELDFVVENKTDKTLLVCCFAYQKTSDQDSFIPWKYHKTKVQKLAPNETTAIDINTIRELYDWIYMRGFLAIFDSNQEKEAQEATYELLRTDQKLNLGRLADLLGKKISISIQKYGASNKIFDFQPEPFKPLNIAELQKRKKNKSIF